MKVLITILTIPQILPTRFNNIIIFNVSLINVRKITEVHFGTFFKTQFKIDGRLNIKN